MSLFSCTLAVTQPEIDRLCGHRRPQGVNELARGGTTLRCRQREKFSACKTDLRRAKWSWLPACLEAFPYSVPRADGNSPRLSWLEVHQMSFPFEICSGKPATLSFI